MPFATRNYLLFSVFIFFNSVNAQEPPEETIVVTGSRTDAVLSETSHNITQINQQQLALLGATHITEVLNQVAGVWISRGNGQEHLTAIRSPVLTGAGACGAFFMAEDGISLRAPGFCNANQLFDVNSEQAGAIEVVRGPAGVVYGSNAVHGVLNVVSPQWQNLPELQASLESGPHQYQRAKISTKSQSGQHKGALWGVFTHDGGYQQESGFEQQKINLKHEYSNDGYAISNHLSYSNLNQETAGFIQGFEAYKNAALKQKNPNPEAYRDSRSLRIWSNISLQRDNLDILLKPYFRYHHMTFLQHFLPWKATEDNGHRSLGILSSATLESADYTITSGLDIDYTLGWLNEFQDNSFSDAIPQGAHYDYDVNATSISPFIDMQYRLNNKVTLHTGLRFEHTQYDYDNNLSDGSACASQVSDCRFYRPGDEHRNFSNWSAKLGVNYRITEEHGFYTQISHGYRPPQVSELFRLQNGQASANLTSENMLAIEMGLRGLLTKSAQTVIYDFSLYNMAKSDHIFQDSLRQNVSEGETQHQGIELSLNWQLDPEWQVNLAMDYNHHTYANNPDIAAGVSIRGNQIDTAPKFNMSTRLKWTQDLFQAELEWLYMDSYYLDPANSAEYDGHQLLNLRARISLAQHLELSFRLHNLLNSDYAQRADYAFGNYRYFVGEPRSLYIAISYEL